MKMKKTKEKKNDRKECVEKTKNMHTIKGKKKNLLLKEWIIGEKLLEIILNMIKKKIQ